MTVTIHNSIHDIGECRWRQLAGHTFPFHDFRFLAALEDSGSIGERTGWYPQYIAIELAGKLVGASYLYVKANSYGEYIFDWAWADAYYRYGLDYYPKLTASIPFTPATGPKLLVAPDSDINTVSDVLIRAALGLVEHNPYSSLHYLFVPANEVARYDAHGFGIRHTIQFHWHNRNYESFDDFLAQLKQKKRREIKRERQALENAGVEIRVFTGSQLTSEMATVMYRFYITTIDKKASADYLTADFFSAIVATMGDRIVLILAQLDGEWIAGTINFVSDTALYGRYWGCTKTIKNLHFELCYYQTVEYAIANKLQLVEAGAQGGHKVQRGFSPTRVFSAHWLARPEMHSAVMQFLDDERAELDQHLEQRGNSWAYRDSDVSR